ncbi:hypothetical protein AA313_de0204384 [Arthrobotrys entomopaga]|nr:hypothetical protein AA313_de0204384 [Arthrobotrys entomopaga]
MATPPSSHRRALSFPNTQPDQPNSPSPPLKRIRSTASGSPDIPPSKPGVAISQEENLVVQLPSPANTHRSSKSVSPGLVRFEQSPSLKSPLPVIRFQKADSPIPELQRTPTPVYRLANLDAYKLESSETRSLRLDSPELPTSRSTSPKCTSYPSRLNERTRDLSSWSSPTLCKSDLSIKFPEKVTDIEDEEDEWLVPAHETIARMISERAAEDLALDCRLDPATPGDLKFPLPGELEICQRVIGNPVMSEKEKRAAFRQDELYLRDLHGVGEYKGNDYSNLFEHSCFSNPHVRS